MVSSAAVAAYAEAAPDNSIMIRAVRSICDRRPLLTVFSPGFGVMVIA
jgi:hypothetical protein